MKPGICELWEVMRLHVYPESSGNLPNHEVLDLSGDFPLATGKGCECSMDFKTARDSEATETGENGLLSLKMLWRGILIVVDNATGSLDTFN